MQSSGHIEVHKTRSPEFGHIEVHKTRSPEFGHIEVQVKESELEKFKYLQHAKEVICK
ncbi:hypothetical protein [Borrelia sp. RT5S]|uniref:hypothetical protein n=1 Tax=Borrelia sp. RT5S TaxID=2898581 RepID=UPI001E466F02|nr:hypothetical protein [Borrelia sp. RT5S]UGQ16716.1 hypothetical protein LSO06_05195 [Borrelia sp. RT5S]